MSDEARVSANDRWRQALLVGLPIGLGFAAAKSISEALLPEIGYWGACALGLVGAAAAAALTSVIVERMLRRAR